MQQQRVGAGVSGTAARHAQLGEHWLQRRGIPGLARGDHHHQRAAGVVDEQVHLRAQATAGPAQGVVAGFVPATERAGVSRLSPL